MYVRIALERCGGARGGQLTFPHSEGEEGKKRRFSVGREATVELQVVEKRVEREKPLWSPVGSLCGEPYEIPQASPWADGAHG